MKVLEIRKYCDLQLHDSMAELLKPGSVCAIHKPSSLIPRVPFKAQCAAHCMPEPSFQYLFIFSQSSQNSDASYTMLSPNIPCV